MKTKSLGKVPFSSFRTYQFDGFDITIYRISVLHYHVHITSSGQPYALLNCNPCSSYKVAFERAKNYIIDSQTIG